MGNRNHGLGEDLELKCHGFWGALDQYHRFDASVISSDGICNANTLSKSQVFRITVFL
jgi:hypothetical protein